MKAYLATTGVVFGLITLAHFARVYDEGPERARDSVFVGLTVLTAGLCPRTWRAIAVVVVTALIGCSEPKPTLSEGQRRKNEAQDTAELIAISLEAAQSIDVYSLNARRIDGQLPQPQGTEYLDHFRILETRALEENGQYELSSSLRKDLLDNWDQHGIAECFDPHHGVRIQTPEKTIYLVIGPYRRTLLIGVLSRDVFA